MNQLPVMLKREMQEQRGIFLYSPLIAAAFCICIMLIGLMLVNVDDNGISIQVSREYHDGELVNSQTVLLGAYWGERLEQLASMSPEKRERTLGYAYRASVMPLLFIMWLTVFFYLLGSLYDDRRDRSILFWKSMPVSDGLTVASKFLSATIIAPLVYLACGVVVQIALLIISTVSAIGLSVDPIEVLWRPGNMAGGWFELMAYHLLSVLWCLPFYAWLILVSSWARTVPLAWALGVPIAITIVDKLFLPGEYVSSWMSRHSTPLGYDDKHLDTLGDALSRVISLEMLVSLMIAGAMIFGAIYFRSRADEI